MIDICSISAVAFKANLCKEENVFFVTLLFKIDYELKAHNYETRKPMDTALEEDALLQHPDETELQWLKRILPEELKEYADVFSKEASNMLLPHRSYDHKIRIDDPDSSESLRYSSLHHQSMHELQETKQFLEENF
jgi:hypothetical protein